MNFKKKRMRWYVLVQNWDGQQALVDKNENLSSVRDLKCWLSEWLVSLERFCSVHFVGLGKKLWRVLRWYCKQNVLDCVQVTTPSEKRRNPYRMYNPMTLQELQHLTDSVQTSSSHAKVCNWFCIQKGICCGAVSWGAVLHVVRSWVLFSMGLLGILIDLILLAALWPWSLLSL
jgi:hypothetical protein